MWTRALIIILLFYFFAIFQNSFLPYFNILGTVPNIIFIFFFLLIFFSVSKREPGGPVLDWTEIFYALIAGFFLDIFSSLYFGVSIATLLLISILTKKTINSLKEKEEEYPIVYFIFLFLGFFIIYEIILHLCFYFLNQNYGAINLSWIIIVEIIYNLVSAFLGFYIYKKINKLK